MSSNAAPAEGGLGLAHGLARAMGGDLSIGSSGPAGTSMHLRSPRAETLTRQDSR